MRCATTTATVLLCFLISFVHVQSKLSNFETWVTDQTTATGTLKYFCGTENKTPATLETACEDGAQCSAAADQAKTDCETMCGSFSTTYFCDGTLKDQMTQFMACINADGNCPKNTDVDNYSCTAPCIKTYATSASVTNFLTWVAGEQFQADCVTNHKDVSNDECTEAAKKGVPSATGATGTGTPDNWGAMCAALANFDCTDAGKDVTEFEKCCKNEEAPAGCLSKAYTDNNDWTGEGQCCAECIKASQTTTKPPPSSHSAPTTMGPTPSPGPTPSSSDSGDDKDTTTEEPSGGSDSDSAINIGASGLLVTLITMMAAGVNIA